MPEMVTIKFEDLSAAFDFVSCAAPSEYASVETCCRHRGAYARFKELLAVERCLDKWYAFAAHSSRYDAQSDVPGHAGLGAERRVDVTYPAAGRREVSTLRGIDARASRVVVVKPR